MSASGTKPTSLVALHMSANDPKRTFKPALQSSATVWIRDLYALWCHCEVAQRRRNIWLNFSNQGRQR